MPPFSYAIPTATPVADPLPSHPFFRSTSMQTTIETELVQLVKRAHELGFEITVDQVAAQPLRMGNKITRIEVTPHHKPPAGA